MGEIGPMEIHCMVALISLFTDMNEMAGWVHFLHPEIVFGVGATGEDDLLTSCCQYLEYTCSNVFFYHIQSTNLEICIV
jgi:hypothetical protein